MRQRGSARRFRLFCFSYAGGSAAPYLAWQAALPPAVEVCAVQLPGRGPRLLEPPLRSMSGLVDVLAPVVAREADLPFALFGHSLGGLLAFELARHFQRNGMPMPQRLFVSASSAPGQRSNPKRLHALGDDALIEALRDYNGTPPAALADRELMALLLPAIRADFAVVDTYRYAAGAPLDIPISVLAGRQDRHVAPASLQGWQGETRAACTTHWFDGDHFFIHAQQRAVVDCIRAGLGALPAD